MRLHCTRAEAAEGAALCVGVAAHGAREAAPRVWQPTGQHCSEGSQGSCAAGVTANRAALHGKAVTVTVTVTVTVMVTVWVQCKNPGYSSINMML